MNMKPFFVSFAVIVIAIATACQSNVDPSEKSLVTRSTDVAAIPDSIPGSPRSIAIGNIGNADIHIDYSTPAVRGRIVWGGLVPLGTIWVTGAHDATSITFPVDVNIEGQQISAGKYAFFTIPGESEWTLVLNKNWEQHLTRDYDQLDDVLRWSVTPITIEHTERLRYDVISTGEATGRITMTWEKIQIGFDFSI